jgi:colanic acid/amylovoran biosynthesis glycosyltransferase
MKTMRTLETMNPARTTALRAAQVRPVKRVAIESSVSGSPKVLYVLKRFPQLSQTFVVRELLELERLGMELGVEALAPFDNGLTHADVAGVAASVRYLPRRPKLRDGETLRAHLRVGIRRPITWVRLARAAHQGDWRRFVQAGLVADRVRKEGYDHVHAHFATAACEVARDAAALAGCQYSVTAHAKDIFHEQHAPHLYNRVQGAHAVVTVSAFNERHLNRVVPNTQIVHIPNAVKNEAARPQPAVGPVLCVARLVEKKGIDTLLRAIAIARESNPSLRAEIIGGGELLDRLQDLRDELGLQDHVEFLGSQTLDQVDAAYRRCSMMVLPCRIDQDGDRDGLPTVIVEAFARGVPVISTAIIGIPEVVRHGVTGLLVEPDDAMALSDAIRSLLDDPDRASTLGSQGRSLVAAEFDPERSARRLAAVFASAAGARR